MQIVMMITQFGSPDGIHIHRFVEGEVHDADTWPMSRELAQSFLQAKAAEIVENNAGPAENKDDASAVVGKQRKEARVVTNEEAAVETTSSKRRNA